MGKLAARPGKTSCAAHLIFDETRIVSAAAAYAEIQWHLVSLETGRSLAVLDEEGKFVGSIRVSAVRRNEGFASPSEATTADDIVSPSDSLDSKLSIPEMDQQLKSQRVTEMPVIEKSSGRFLGFYSRKESS